ncbi:MAG: spore coat associated protein CotJA [Pelosinus sp.]|nr:spore coat associated protein CotJA [Pelosinus sp.]
MKKKHSYWCEDTKDEDMCLAEEEMGEMHKDMCEEPEEMDMMHMHKEHMGMHGHMMHEHMMHMPMHKNMRLAHAYVPWQCYTKAFSPCEALNKGTLFPELFGVYKLPV